MAPKGEPPQQHETAQQAGVSVEAIQVMHTDCQHVQLPACQQTCNTAPLRCMFSRSDVDCCSHGTQAHSGNCKQAGVVDEVVRHRWPADPAVRCYMQANTKQLAATCASLKAQREARAANVKPTRPGEAAPQQGCSPQPFLTKQLYCSVRRAP